MRRKIRLILQKDSMQCGVACLGMISAFYGKEYSLATLSRYCHDTTDGVSMLGISQGAKSIGLKSIAVKISISQLSEINTPCILHWNQNHFVVFYKITRKGNFRIADPAKGIIDYPRDEFESHWISAKSEGVDKGLAMFLEPDDNFGSALTEDNDPEKRSFLFLLGYLKEYRRYFLQIFLGLTLGCLLQLIMPFLTQAIVDMGIRHKDIGFIWLILLGELMIVTGRTATDFIRRWLLLHISMRINISLVSEYN